MPESITIELKGARFFAYHGLYPGERTGGGNFEADLSVTYIPPDGTITALGDTIDYGHLYDLLANEMKEPRELLETFVMEVAEKILQAYPSVTEVEIAVKKITPPIPGFTGTAGVRYKKRVEAGRY